MPKFIHVVVYPDNTTVEYLGTYIEHSWAGKLVGFWRIKDKTE